MTEPSLNQSVGQQRNFRRHTAALLSTGVLAAAIAYLTLSPPLPSELGGFLSDKAHHFIAFAALVFPCALLFARSLIWVLPTALLFGGAIELTQPFVGRAGEGADFLADVFGVGVGAAVGLAMRAILVRRVPVRATTGT